jgi:hypothetical protein
MVLLRTGMRMATDMHETYTLAMTEDAPGLRQMIDEPLRDGDEI